MANICEYHVIVTGKKIDCYAFYWTTPTTGCKYVLSESGTDDKFELKFVGSCDGSVNFPGADIYTGECPVCLPETLEEAEPIVKNTYMNNTVKHRSSMFNVEVKCNSADVSSDIFNVKNIYEHYKSGNHAKGKCPEELLIPSFTREKSS